MFILGLTGSIGMGKSTAAAMLRRMGIPVHDADAVVHRLLGPGGRAVPLIAQGFPDVIDASGGIDRAALGQQVFNNPAALKKLEGILHPLVRNEEHRFLATHRRCGTRLVVLDIPLLFETGADRRVDAVAVVTAPPFIQRARVLSRPGMTPERFAHILSRQMPDKEKRRHADFIVPTGLGRAVTWLALEKLLRKIENYYPL